MFNRHDEVGIHNGRQFLLLRHDGGVAPGYFRGQRGAAPLGQPPGHSLGLKQPYHPWLGNPLAEPLCPGRILLIG